MVIMLLHLIPYAHKSYFRTFKKFFDEIRRIEGHLKVVLEYENALARAEKEKLGVVGVAGQVRELHAPMADGEAYGPTGDVIRTFFQETSPCLLDPLLSNIMLGRDGDHNWIAP